MSKGKLLAICLVWLFIFGIVALAWKLIVTPSREKTAQQAKDQADQNKLDKTSGSSRYDHEIRLALDSFSGYAVFRSQRFREQLAGKRIKLELDDDGANYPQRLQALDQGDVQLAVFTVDALIKASAELGELPATIVALIDETRGADAMVAYQEAVPNVDALNHESTKFVLTPDSPSETLARVVIAHFNLDALSDDPFVRVGSGAAADVFEEYKNSRPDTRQVFVLWEPYVSKILENPKTHTVVDSSRFRGYIVDVLVVNRDYLVKNPEVVADVVESYFRALHAYRDEMFQLVLDDARQLGTPLTDEQAKRLVEGVWWKNTQENYAHLGQLHGGSLQHLEDMIANITNVLLSTGAIAADPTNNQPNRLYYDRILADLKAAEFHPGLDVEKIRDETSELPRLDDTRWDELVPVGTLQVPPLVFARGTSKLTSRSRLVLDDLIGKLVAWPQYYLLIRGNASLQGDLDANTALALARAKSAEAYLIQNGVHENRVRAVGGEPSGTTSVSFVLGQTPY